MMLTIKNKKNNKTHTIIKIINAGMVSIRIESNGPILIYYSRIDNFT